MCLLRFLVCLSFLVGSSIADPAGRVVNGTNSNEGEFPFMVSLQWFGSHRCGCSILNRYWILTAAHCVQYTPPKSLSIFYGVTKLSSSGSNVAHVADIVLHEGFNPASDARNDVAVLRLAEPLEFNDLVQPIRLPPFKLEVPERSLAILVGWGYEKTEGFTQNHLQKVDLVTFSDEECNSRHNGKTYPSQICGGVPEGGKGQCSGDSGGPLVYDGQQIGIVSWSVKPCAAAPYPGVYTKVSHFVDWIESKVGQVYH